MPAEDSSRQCACAKCFLQSQFVPITLAGASLVALTFCIYIMTHFRDDADVVWAQGILKEMIAAFLVSLVGAPRPTSHQGDTIKTGDNTTVLQTADSIAPVVPQEGK